MRTLTRTGIILLAVLALATFVACGDRNNGGTNIDGGGTDPTGDGGTNPTADGGTNNGADAAPPPIGCDANAAQCNNCIDDDSDGDTDGADVHCISALDNDESSFATGISGDNRDSTWQDCFFDGNSGAGDDGCRYHSCCLLGQANCPDNNFDPATDCQVDAGCAEFCAPSAPPGCDCFGCCTLCNDSGACFDVIVNPAVPGAENCDVDATGTPVNCPVCTQSTECGSACDNANCTLCPGQTPQDLPPECMEQNVCQGDAQVCDAMTPCGAGDFCLSGCCVPQIG